LETNEKKKNLSEKLNIEIEEKKQILERLENSDKELKNERNEKKDFIRLTFKLFCIFLIRCF